MVRATLPVRSLGGGVSQQPDPIRLPGSCTESVNAMFTMTEGLRKRPPTMYEGKLDVADDFESEDVKHHTIRRGDTELYHVMVRNNPGVPNAGELKVFDMLKSDRVAEGIQPKPLKDSTGSAATASDLTYLSTADPVNDIEFLTIADHTLVLNKSVTVAMKADKTYSRYPEGMVVIESGNYATTYSVTVRHSSLTGGYTQAWYYTEGSQGVDGLPPAILSAERSIRSSTIRNSLMEALTAPTINTGNYPRTGRTGDELKAANGFQVSATKHIIAIWRTDTSDFGLTAGDTVSDSAMRVVKDTIQLFEDLPTAARDNTYLEVKGDPEETDIGYWVRFTTTTGVWMDEGTWAETTAPNITYKLDETTLPHLLIRQSDGNFRFTPLGLAQTGTAAPTVPSWGARYVGDLTTNKNPSFVGRKIRSLFFWKDRLGILAGERCVLSEASEYFSFFKTTVLSLLDSARIDLTVPTNDVVLLNHAVPVSDLLILFSKTRQFALQTSGPLTPTSVSIFPVSAFETDENISPIPVADYIVSAVNRGDYSSINEIRDVSSQRPNLQSLNITGPLPRYIDKDMRVMTVSPTENLLAVVPKRSRDGTTIEDIFLYSWFFNGNERIQSAWQGIQLYGACNVRHVHFVGTKLYIVVERLLWGGTATSIYLESIDFSSLSGESYVSNRQAWLLDRQVTLADCTRSYNSALNETTITLPYVLGISSSPDTMYVIDNIAKDQNLTVNRFTVKSVAGGDGDEIVVKGDALASSHPEDWLVGEIYNMSYVFSRPYLQDERGGPIPIADLRIRMGNLVFDKATHFVVEVLSNVNAQIRGKSASDWFPSSFQDGPGPSWTDDVISHSTFSGLGLSLGSIIGHPTPSSGRFRFGVMSKAADVQIRVRTNLPFGCRLISMDWEVSYSTRGQRL